MDDVKFLCAVPVGSVCSFSAIVVFSDPTNSLVQVKVTAEVINQKTLKKSITNVFQFTFRCSSLKNTVQPLTYEGMIDLSILRLLMRFIHSLTD